MFGLTTVLMDAFFFTMYYAIQSPYIDTKEGLLKYKVFDHVKIDHDFYAGCESKINGMIDKHLRTDPPSYEISLLFYGTNVINQKLTFAEDNLIKVAK